MTPHAIARVQESFREVAFNGALVADIFYDRLFDTAPQVRVLFPEQMGEQKRKLIQMLAFVVQSLSKPDELLPAVRSLGARHAGYGARPAHYAVVGAALLWTLERVLGDGLDAEARAAWADAYGMLADVMIAAQAAA